MAQGAARSSCTSDSFRIQGLYARTSSGKALIAARASLKEGKSPYNSTYQSRLLNPAFL